MSDVVLGIERIVLYGVEPGIDAATLRGAIERGVARASGTQTWLVADGAPDAATARTVLQTAVHDAVSPFVGRRATR